MSGTQARALPWEPGPRGESPAQAPCRSCDLLRARWLRKRLWMWSGVQSDPGPWLAPPEAPSNYGPKSGLSPVPPCARADGGGRGPNWAQGSRSGSGRRALTRDPECKGHALPAPAPQTSGSMSSPPSVSPAPVSASVSVSVSVSDTADPASTLAGLHPLRPSLASFKSLALRGSGAVLSQSSGCRVSGEGLWGAQRGGGGDPQAEDHPGWWASPLPEALFLHSSSTRSQREDPKPPCASLR